MGNDGNSLLSYTFLWCNDAAAFCSVNGSYRNKRAFGAGFRRVVTQKSSALKSAASGLGLVLVLLSESNPDFSVLPPDGTQVGTYLRVFTAHARAWDHKVKR